MLTHSKHAALRTAFAIGLASAGWISGASTATAQTGNIVSTRAGQVQGVSERDTVAFKAIPYAAPPTGILRWREPQPAASWQGVRSGAAFGNSCMQVPGLSAANGAGDPGPLSEDCLYLNVWTPAPDISAKLPVMVWIHGGAYVFGSGSVPFYNGAPLAKKGAVVVTINYRLGSLGFFAHPALAKESPVVTANFGLLDQIAALKWVRENIAAFGGNPNNVTIMGQSAGAKSVLALFASPLSGGLFQKGVALSSYGIPDKPLFKAIEASIKVSAALGVKAGKATAAELRAIPADKLIAAKVPGVAASPVPIAGDKVLPVSIRDMFALGKEAAVPLLIGSTSDDSSVASAFGVDPAAVLQRMRVAGFFLKLLYPGVNGESELARLTTRDAVFTMPAREVAERHSRIAPTWRYYFDYVAANDRAKFPNGAPHSGEVIYFLHTGDVYDEIRARFTDADREVARKVSDYLIEFARSGKPAPDRGAPWPPYRIGQDRTMVFNGTPSPQADFMKVRLTAFARLARVMAATLAKS